VKAFSFGFALLATASLGACAKKNDVATLRHEAVSVAKYYAPKLDALDARVQTIFKRGSTIPANLPGIDVVGQNLTRARDTIIQLRGVVGPGADGKSAVEKQADAAAKERKVEDLEKLTHDTEVMLERGLTVINDDLSSVESWIAQYDNHVLATIPARPTPPPGSAPAPVTEGAGTTGQPPGAAPAPGGAPAQPAPPAPAPAHP
jgi:hypothetical protein